MLINPDISLTGPLETRPKEKQKNFQKMKQILKCRNGPQAIIGSVDGLSPIRHRTITWTNAGNGHS